jgi:hypothetical protein
MKPLRYKQASPFLETYYIGTSNTPPAPHHFQVTQCGKILAQPAFHPILDNNDVGPPAVKVRHAVTTNGMMSRASHVTRKVDRTKMS